MNDKQLEQVARELCLLRGEDPDERVQFGDALDTLILGPRWQSVRVAVREAWLMAEAMKNIAFLERSEKIEAELGVQYRGPNAPKLQTLAQAAATAKAKTDYKTLLAAAEAALEHQGRGSASTMQFQGARAYIESDASIILDESAAQVAVAGLSELEAKPASYDCEWDDDDALYLLSRDTDSDGSIILDESAFKPYRLANANHRIVCLQNDILSLNRQIARLQSGNIIESDLLTAVDDLWLVQSRIRELEAYRTESRRLAGGLTEKDTDAAALNRIQNLRRMADADEGIEAAHIAENLGGKP